ncbi:unnamed protein product [Closterium sp. NIES-64]|nr:unnamed protein product [Closterium sp. NIES-64]
MPLAASSPLIISHPLLPLLPTALPIRLRYLPIPLPTPLLFPLPTHLPFLSNPSPCPPPLPVSLPIPLSFTACRQPLPPCPSPRTSQCMPLIACPSSLIPPSPHPPHLTIPHSLLPSSPPSPNPIVPSPSPTSPSSPHSEPGSGTRKWGCWTLTCSPLTAQPARPAHCRLLPLLARWAWRLPAAPCSPRPSPTHAGARHALHVRSRGLGVWASSCLHTWRPYGVGPWCCDGGSGEACKGDGVGGMDVLVVDMTPGMQGGTTGEGQQGRGGSASKATLPAHALSSAGDAHAPMRSLPPAARADENGGAMDVVVVMMAMDATSSAGSTKALECGGCTTPAAHPYCLPAHLPSTMPADSLPLLHSLHLLVALHFPLLCRSCSLLTLTRSGGIDAAQDLALMDVQRGMNMS